MEFLQQKLPKDLVNIIEEYAKDRTNYDKVISDLNLLIHNIRIFSENIFYKTTENNFIDQFILNVFFLQDRDL